jgi:hypothetical protein
MVAASISQSSEELLRIFPSNLTLSNLVKKGKKGLKKDLCNGTNIASKLANFILSSHL